jgi:hypothetical protein
MLNNSHKKILSSLEPPEIQTPCEKKLFVIPSLFRWRRQWWHHLMCKCCQSTKQCQPINKKKWRGEDERMWTCSYKTWNPKSLAMDAKISEQHCRIQSCPHHGHNERDGSPWVLTIDQNSMNFLMFLHIYE